MSVNAACTAIAASLVAASAAHAGIIGPGITITAQNANGTATYTVELDDPFAETFPNGDWRYVLPDPVELRDPNNNNVIGVLNELRGDIFSNPHVLIVFDFTAAGIETSFTVNSALEIVGPIPGTVAAGAGAATLTLADTNGGGATLTGNYGDGSIHHMLINGNAPGTGDVLISALTGPFSVGSGTDFAFENIGPVPAGVTVTSIASQFSFTLSGGDTATGTSTFAIIPTPGALALLGLGAVTLGYRRKR